LLDTLYEVKFKLLIPSPTNCERSPLLNWNALAAEKPFWMSLSSRILNMENYS
jgi:hypothetical protein